MKEMLADLLNDKPDQVTEYMIKWLSTKGIQLEED